MKLFFFFFSKANLIDIIN